MRDAWSILGNIATGLHKAARTYFQEWFCIQCYCIMLLAADQQCNSRSLGDIHLRLQQPGYICLTMSLRTGRNCYYPWLPLLNTCYHCIHCDVPSLILVHKNTYTRWKSLYVSVPSVREHTPLDMNSSHDHSGFMKTSAFKSPREFIISNLGCA